MTNNLHKKDARHLKIAWPSKRQNKSKIKQNKIREKRTKTDKSSKSNNKCFFACTFLYRTIYILLKRNIYGKLIL